MPKWQQILSAVNGIGFLLMLLGIALFVPQPTEFQVFIFRTVLGLAAGAFVTIVSGFIHVEVRWQKLVLRAGAGLAVFAVIYLVNPPQLIRELSGGKGFIPPETIRGGDKSAALVVPADGSTLSLLVDSLVLDLQTDRDELDATVTTALSISIVRNDDNPVESVVNHLRGAVYLSRNSAATITVNIGGRIVQYDFPAGDNKPGMALDRDIYQMHDFFRQVTTPIAWSSGVNKATQYPITLSLKAARQAKSDVAMVAIDSLDAAVRFEGRASR